MMKTERKQDSRKSKVTFSDGLNPAYLDQYSNDELTLVRFHLERGLSSHLYGVGIFQQALRLVDEEVECRAGTVVYEGLRDIPNDSGEYLVNRFREYPFKAVLKNLTKGGRPHDLVSVATSMGFVADWNISSSENPEKRQQLDQALLTLKNSIAPKGASKQRLDWKLMNQYVSAIPERSEGDTLSLPFPWVFESGSKISRLKRFAELMQVMRQYIFSKSALMDLNTQSKFSEERGTDVPSLTPPTESDPFTNCEREEAANAELYEEKRNNSDWQQKLADTHPFDDRIASRPKRENMAEYFQFELSRLEAKPGMLTSEEVISTKAISLVLTCLAFSYHPFRDAVRSRSSELGIDLNQMTMERNVRMPNEAFDSSEPFYLERTDNWDCPLPELIVRSERLLKKNGVGDQTLQDLCATANVDGEQAISKLLIQISDRYYQAPIAIDQFEEQLPLLMKNMNYSDAEVYWCVGRDFHIPPVQCHYESSTVSEIIHRHHLAFETYMSGAVCLEKGVKMRAEPGGPAIGACRMNPQEWKGMLNGYRLDYENAHSMSFEDSVCWHNSLTRLTLLFLLVVTGIRMTNYPLAFLLQRSNEDFSLVFPEDKVSSAFHERRVTALPLSARIVIANYIKHLQRLALQLWRSGRHELAGRFQALITPGVHAKELSLGFFTELSSTMQYQHITKGEFEKSLGPNWLPRIDEARVQLCCYLKHIGVADYLIEDQLGHMLACSPQFSAKHSYSMAQFRQEMQPYLEDYAKWLGWSYA